MWPHSRLVAGGTAAAAGARARPLTARSLSSRWRSHTAPDIEVCSTGRSPPHPTAPHPTLTLTLHRTQIAPFSTQMLEQWCASGSSSPLSSMMPTSTCR